MTEQHQSFEQWEEDYPPATTPLQIVTEFDTNKPVTKEESTLTPEIRARTMPKGNFSARRSRPPSWFTNYSVHADHLDTGHVAHMERSPGKAPVAFDWVLPLAPPTKQWHLSGKNKLPSMKVRSEEWRNHVMLQTFHWFSPDESLFRELSIRAPQLKAMGISSLWFPPVGKGAEGVNDIGYAVYDLYDLGEHDQKGTVRTRWGTRAELDYCIKTLHDNGLKAIADVVLNQRQGGDERELVTVQEYDPWDRQKKIGEEFEAYAWTKFNCKGSDYQWNKDSFETVGWVEFKDEKDEFYGREGIFQIKGRPLELAVSKELNGYSFLCACDVWESNQKVEDELVRYGKWLLQDVKFDAFRLDAVKHISYNFFARWLYRVRGDLQRNIFAVGEYYSNNIEELDEYVSNTEQSMSIFDFPLRTNILMTSMNPHSHPLQNILDGTVVGELPNYAVTFVDNHDLQPLREPHDSRVREWFLPHAYALLLLRKDGYPCVFYPHLYGCVYKAPWPGSDDPTEHEIVMQPVAPLPVLLHLRQTNAWGEEFSYIKFIDKEGNRKNDDLDFIAWTRRGDQQYQNSGLAACLNVSDQPKAMKMFVGTEHAEKDWMTAIGDKKETVRIDCNGEGVFPVGPKSISVYIPAHK